MEVLFMVKDDKNKEIDVTEYISDNVEHTVNWLKEKGYELDLPTIQKIEHVFKEGFSNNFDTSVPLNNTGFSVYLCDKEKMLDRRQRDFEELLEKCKEVARIVEENDLLLDSSHSIEVSPLLSSVTGAYEWCELSVLDEYKNGNVFDLSVDDTVQDILKRLYDTGYIDQSYKKYCATTMSYKI